MQMSGEQRIAASRVRVWQALNEPEILKQCIPGCQSLEQAPDGRLKATVAIKIGPIGARFSGTVTLSDLDPPNGYTITGDGQAGTVGSAAGSAKIRLADDDGGTQLSYVVDAQVSGRLAQLGGPIIDATAKQLAGKFFEQFDSIVGAPAEAAATVQPTGTPAIGSPAYAPPSSGFPVAWLLAQMVAALVGYLIGHAHGGGSSDWMGLAIGLLLMIVAAAAFEYGRRTAATVLMLDPALLARISEDAKR